MFYCVLGKQILLGSFDQTDITSVLMVVRRLYDIMLAYEVLLFAIVYTPE